MSMMRFDPFGDMLSLRDAMNQLLEESFVSPGRMVSSGSAASMALDVRETPDAFVVDAVLPGVKPENVDITIQDNVLVISAETKQEQTKQQGQAHLSERRYGRFSRAVSLPTQVNAEGVQATLENGILHLQIPKAEQVKPRKITVHAGGAQSQPVDVTPPNEQGGAQREDQAIQDPTQEPQKDQVGA